MSTATKPAPIFAEMTAKQSWTLLSRNHVGRLAFFNHGAMDIEPVNYVASDPWIFVRSAEGTKLEVFDHHPWTAFEVDEVGGPFDWRSVVARGTVYMMADSGSPVDRAIFDKALKALRSFMPAALTAADPTPMRTHVYGIHVDTIIGRVARQRSRQSDNDAIHSTAVPAKKRRRRSVGS